VGGDLFDKIGEVEAMSGVSWIRNAEC
jgi:hypothetical protein